MAERRPLQKVECSSAEDLAAVFIYYGFGISGWAALRQTMEAAYRAPLTSETPCAAFAPSFAAATKDAKSICGGLYARLIEFASPEELIAILESYLERRARGSKDCTAVAALVKDKIELIRRARIKSALYVDVTNGFLILRINDDQVKADKGRVHGMQLEIYLKIKRAVR